MNVLVDPAFDEAERRRRLYAGDVIVYTHVAEVAAFAAFTRDALRTVFAPGDPLAAHTAHTAAELTAKLVEFKPRFIHDPRSMEHVRRICAALGCRVEDVYADFPKPRTAFPRGHLDTGIAYAFQPHRDTWYAAPPNQLNWWLPVWEVDAANCMEFFPARFGRTIENDSGAYNYYLANAWRGRITEFSGAVDARVHPAPTGGLPAGEPRLTVVPPLGGVMLFSGDHLHASIPNTTDVTRYSVDFRTVHRADVAAGRGAPAVDVRCAGTALRDFHRLSDGAAFTEDEVEPYDTPGADVPGAVQVFHHAP